MGGGEREHGPPLYHSFFSSFPNLLSLTRLRSCICLEQVQDKKVWGVQFGTPHLFFICFFEPRGKVQHQSKHANFFFFILICFFQSLVHLEKKFIHNQNIPSDWNIPSIQGFIYIFYFKISSKKPIFIVIWMKNLLSIHKFWKFVTFTYGIGLEQLLCCWIYFAKIYKPKSV